MKFLVAEIAKEPRTRAGRRSVGLGPAEWCFSFAVGLLLPFLCRALDRSGGSLGILHERGAPTPPGLFAESVALLSMAALGVWLLLRRPSPYLAGMLLGGAVLALTIGLVLLPFAVLTWIAGVGLFLAIPLATAWVYARQGLRALLQDGRERSRRARRTLVALGLATGLGLPALFAGSFLIAVDRSVDGLLSGDERRVEAAVRRLGRWDDTIGVDLGRVERLHASAWETDPARAEELASLYERVKGRSIGGS